MKLLFLLRTIRFFHRTAFVSDSDEGNNREYFCSGTPFRERIFSLRKMFWIGICSIMLLIYPLRSHASDSIWNRIHFGITGGIHLNSTHFSELDNNYFPDPKLQSSGVFGLFAEFELGRSRRFSLRPELMFLSRGTKISDIANIEGYYWGENDGFSLEYEHKTHFIDIRVPILYYFTPVTMKFRPYLYVAPVIGFATGGNISATGNEESGHYSATYKMDVSKANMASVYVAGALGAGFTYPLTISERTFHFGIDLNYQYGFTDTYASMEKDGEALSKGFFTAYDIKGTRKFSGFEVRASVSVPLSIFKKRRKEVVLEPVPVVVPPPVAVAVPEKDCYTLDEILELMRRNEPIEGKTICAIDLINFEFGKSELNAVSREYLDKIAAMILRSNASIKVKGHTDNVGTEEFNMDLSQKRAKAVYDYLLKKGISASKLSYSYYGMSRPIASNDTEEGRMMNRRVEFEILNK